MNPLVASLTVMAGGALGALLRYALTLLIQNSVQSTFPLGTFAINTAGSFALAFLVFSKYLGLSPTLQLALGTGLLGAFTTFSTYELEGVRLLEAGQGGLALAYLFGSLVSGLLAALLGRWLALQVTA